MNYQTCTNSLYSNSTRKLSEQELNKLIEYGNLSKKQKTLLATNNKYDTIFVKDTKVWAEISNQYGDLNIVINGFLPTDVMLYNSYED